VEQGKLTKRVFTGSGEGTKPAQYNKPINLMLTCSICKRKTVVRTTSLHLYTPEVRKTWTCALHGKSERRKVMEEAKQNQEVSQTGVDERMVTPDEAKAIVSKLRIPPSWRTELLDRYHASSKGLSVFMMDIDAVLDEKVRVKAGADLEKRKAEMREMVKKIVSKILHASDKKPEAEKKDEFQS
jgi:hypothetical protein